MHQYWPVKLAPVLFEHLFFGTKNSDLIKTLLQFVPESDMSVLKAALEDFDSVDMDALVDTLVNLNSRQIPNKVNLPSLLKEIAHKELIQEPMFIIECWREVLHKNLGMIMTENELARIYNELIPTTRKVLDMLHFPANMSAEKNNVAGYLKKFIRNLDILKLPLFLRYCTGSDLLSVQNLKVTFNSSDSSTFASTPVARCCNSVLDLQSTYPSYTQFKGTFNSIFNHSSLWIMDIP